MRTTKPTSLLRGLRNIMSEGKGLKEWEIPLNSRSNLSSTPFTGSLRSGQDGIDVRNGRPAHTSLNGPGTSPARVVRLCGKQLSLWETSLSPLTQTESTQWHRSRWFLVTE